MRAELCAKLGSLNEISDLATLAYLNRVQAPYALWATRPRPGDQHTLETARRTTHQVHASMQRFVLGDNSTRRYVRPMGRRALHGRPLAYHQIYDTTPWRLFKPPLMPWELVSYKISQRETK